MRRKLLPVLVCLICLAVAPAAQAAPSSCPANFAGGQAPDLVNPKLAAKTYALCFMEFSTLDSGLTRTPLYSAEHLTAQRIRAARYLRRSDSTETFHEEQSLPPAARSLLSDYARSGYDRGHLANAGDASTPQSKGETFTLANMMPQNPDDNRNLWEGIEEATRGMATRYGEVYVVTVPIFAGAQTQWLHNRVAIPAHIAKAVYVPALHGAAVYYVDNQPGMYWKTISVEDLEKMAGIDVFPALPASVKGNPITLPAPTPHGGGNRPYSPRRSSRRSRTGW